MLIIRRTAETTLRSIALRSTFPISRNYSKDSSDDEASSKKAAKKETVPETSNKVDQEETAADKLNRLLASMATDDPYSLAKTKANNMARPGDMTKKRRESLKEEIAKKDVFTAAKRVASLLGDQKQQKQTESELLAKLLGHKEDETTKEEDKDKPKKPESEMSLSELIVGMKIDRNPQRTEKMSRSDYVRRTLAAARDQQQQSQGGDGRSKKSRSFQQQQQRKPREAEAFTGSVNLFRSEPMGIFKQIDDLKESPDMLETWSHLQQRDLELQVAHPPSNYFEKMSMWTEQGKVWRFPIDNEQDWPNEEANVDFSEHIFLEQHLESWCPTKGPIRHFMELVCVGLSKNPYLTAREKKNHILWYQNYFEEKRQMLKEYMDLDKPKQIKDEGKVQSS